MPESLLNIQMMGGFCISSGEHRIEEQGKRSPKFWRLIQYLIVNRHKSVPQEELISTIWPDSQQGDPGNAIRNMVFRIRSALAESGLPHGKEMVICSGDGYAWNNSLACVVDFEEFEKLYKRACVGNIAEQARLELLEQALALYKGDLLPNAGADQWAMPVISYYRALYFKCVYAALKLLMERKNYSQAEMVCKKALLIDRFDESVHEFHLRALTSQGKRSEALAEYRKMERMFYEDIGSNLSESLRELYAELQRINSGNASPLDDLMREWGESADFAGAYYCEYGMFRTIYQIEARSVARTGKTIYICSIEVLEIPAKKHSDIMDRLHTVIRDSVRKGDVFTRAGPNQYLVMLPGLTYSNCKVVCRRIFRGLGKRYRPGSIKITVKPIAQIR